MTPAARTERPLRILMVSARYLPFAGGTETHVHEVSSRLAAAGHAVTILTADPDGSMAPRERTSHGVDVVRVRAYPKGKDWCLAPAITRLVAGRLGTEADIVHVQGYHTFVAPFAMLGALISNVPFVLTFHSGGHSSALRMRMRATQQRVLGSLACRAAQLIGVSEFEADHFSAVMGIPRERFVVVPNGASLPRPSVAAQPSSTGPLIVSLGRLERYKGHHRVIEAFARLSGRIPHARLRVLGEGPYESELRVLVSRLGLDDAVEIGSIPAGDRGAMSTLLSGAALVTLLSDYEAHPVAVMEALSLGRPVLTSDTSGFRELARRGLVRPVSLAAAAEDVATAMFGEMSRPRGAPIALPDWDVCAARLLSIYREAARPARAAASSVAAPIGAAP